MINFLFLLIINFSIADFENDFLKKDFYNLDKYFASGKKVYIELSIPLRVYGFFSKSQVLALFREIFQRFENEDFRVAEKMEGVDSLVLKLEWRIRDKLTKDVRITILFMRLSFEDNRWYIAEIKGT